jgi:hypothetical protein
MLVFGTANPEGEDDAHRGVYLRRCDIETLIRTNALHGKPVKIEHTGCPVGHIVSAWKNGNKLDCVLKINDDSIDSMFAQEFIKNRMCPELSLSYAVTMQNSADGLTGGKKDFIEVSLVRSGARKDCHIHGFSAQS